MQPSDCFGEPMLTSRQFIQLQLQENARLLDMAGDDAFTAETLRLRGESLEQELAAATELPPSPRTVLFFSGMSGGPVWGSLGIGARFASDVLTPFQEMVKTQYCFMKHGRSGERGPRKDEEEAELYITALPRGSFGIELSRPVSEDFVAGEQLALSLRSLTSLVEAAAGSSNLRFDEMLEGIAPRVLSSLKTFLDVVQRGSVHLRIQTGNLEASLPPDRVAAALERVGSTEIYDRTIDMEGVFRGATLDTCRFDFRPLAGGKAISGRLSKDFPEFKALALGELMNSTCTAKFLQTTVTANNGTPRVRYELLDLQKLDSPALASTESPSPSPDS